jgi:hypothetical protein
VGEVRDRKAERGKERERKREEREIIVGVKDK